MAAVSQHGGTAKRRRHEEDDLQRAVVAFLLVALPENAVVFAVPNGGARGRAEAARLKGLGVTPGVSDLIIIWAGRVIGVELKAPRGPWRRSQRDWAQEFGAAGGEYFLARSVEEVERILRGVGVPLRAKVMAGNA